MRILANENIPRLLVDALRANGHDVFWARTDAPGDSDEQQLDRARNESRIVLTFDTDFGELAFHQRLPVGSGIVLLRLLGRPDEIANRVSRELTSRSDWDGHFSSSNMIGFE